MSGAGAALAQAAIRLVGCKFRLHGRDPESGLDCVGLVGAALAIAGALPIMPRGYGLRNQSIAEWLPFASRSGLVRADGPMRAGDVLLIALAHSQHHLVIAVDGQKVVHAHAGLKRVVIQRRDEAWTIRAHWRLTAQTEG